MAKAMDEFLTAKEAAAELGLKYHTFMSRCRRGRIPIVRRGWAVFIRKEDVQRVRENGHRDSNLAQAAG